jgi:DNA-binding LacI/PurR family transcriptional regulator
MIWKIVTTEVARFVSGKTILTIGANMSISKLVEILEENKQTLQRHTDELIGCSCDDDTEREELCADHLADWYDGQIQLEEDNYREDQ